MSRASVLMLLFGGVVFVACYYDKSTPEMSPAGTPNNVSPMTGYELTQQPIKFKFMTSTTTDVVEGDTSEVTSDVVKCGGVNCANTDEVCHPTADVCVPCYLDGTVSVNCAAGLVCLVFVETDQTQNSCEPE